MDDIKIRIALEGADQVQAGGQKAADGLKRVGQTGQQAGQQLQLSGQQMAQVSAQLQDLFVQIQGGQAPLTALLQQGSQLSGVFGGFGNAARAVGSLITPTVAVLGTAAAAVGAVTLAYIQGAREAEAYTRAVVLSGNAAGVTVGQLQALAAAQGRVAGSQGEAAEALAALAATGKVAADGLKSAADAAVRLARAGIPLQDTVKKFAALGKEPLKALLDLNEAENFLTVAVYRQVKALEEQGRLREAAALAQSTYAAVGVQRADELAASLTGVEKAWKGIKDEASAAWDAMVNTFRPSAVEAKLAEARESFGILQKISALLTGNAPAQAAYSLAMPSGRDAAEEAARQAARAGEERARALEKARKADEDAAKAAKALNAEREREAAALERAVGLSGSYQKDLTELLKLREKGKLTEEQYVAAVQKLITAQPVIREQLQAQAELEKQVAEAQQRGLELYERKIDALNQSAEAVAKQVQKLRDEEAAIALAAAQNVALAEAIELVTANRLEEQRARALAANDTATAAALQREIDARRELATLMGDKVARDTARKGADDARREWERASADIERSLTDALLRGFESGKGFAQNLRDTLVNMFKTLVLRPIVQPIMGQIAGSVGAVLGLPGVASAAGTAAGAGGMGASSLGALLGLGGLSSAFTGGATLALSGAGGTGLALSGSGALLGSGAYAQGFAQAAGALAPWALGGAAGIFGGRAISGGYSAFGGSGNSAVNIGTIAGAVFGGPIGAAVGGAIGGLVNRAFGRKAKEAQDSGLDGMVTSDGFAGQAFTDWLRKGGWFRSDKRGTDYSAVDAEQDATLDAGVKALYATTAEYAKALGLPVDAVKGYTASFRVLWGKTEEENQKAIQDAFVNLGEQLAGRYAAQLAPLQKAGETLSATLQRLSTLQVFSGSLNNLGGIFSRLASSSVSARERMIELVGGMDALGQQALAFAQNYYTRDEIAGLKAKEVQTTLRESGFNVDLANREQFRALVESLNPTTAEGQRQLAVLLQLQGSFASIADYLGETGMTLYQAADQAPLQANLVSPLLSGVSQQLQLAQQSMDAQYETRDATLQVVQAVKDLAVAIVGGASKSFTPGYREPEVQLAY